MWQPQTDETLLIFRNCHNIQKRQTMGYPLKRSSSSAGSYGGAYKRKKNRVKSRRTNSQKIISLINSQAEKKELWISTSTTNIATTGSVVNCTVLAEGDTAYLRTGRKIMMYDFMIDFTIVAGLLAGQASNLNNVDAGMVWLVLDTHSDGNSTSFLTVFDMTNSNALGGSTFKNEENLGNGNRFIVLKEWPWQVSKGGDGCQHFRELINLRALSQRHQMVHYQSVSADEPTSNSLLLCFANTVSTAATVISYNCRFRFTDL